MNNGKVIALVSVIETVLGTKRRKHIFGGTLFSVSLLFGGLALTAMTLNNEIEKEVNNEYT